MSELHATEARTHWRPEIETLTRDALVELQGERLCRQVRRVYEGSPFFRQLYDKAGVRPSDIRGIEDLRRLPVMDKDDLRAFRAETGDPFSGTLCVPVDQVYRFNKSTGTTGLPNVFGLTEADHAQAADNFARMLWRVGLRPGDRTNSWLEAAMPWHGFSMSAEGARRLGATVFTLEFDNRQVVPANLELLAGASLDAIFIYHPELEITYMRDKGLVPTAIHPGLRFVYSAFLCTAARRRIVEQAWGVPYHNMGASGDQYIPASECAYSAPYLHFMEDQYIVEVLDPSTGEPVGPDTEGELVITNLWGEATPFIRYRMEDVVTADDTPCPCGSTHVRVNYRGRYAWSVTVGESRVFSDDVENVLWRHPETEFAAYQLVKRSQQPQEHLVVRSTVTAGEPSSELRGRLIQALADELGVAVILDFVRPEDVAVGTVKFVRVVGEDG
jgi:phenylacetate-CoA ligase